MISFALTEDQQMVQEMVRKFAAEEIRPRLRELEKAGAVPAALARQFHELGLSLLDVPEALGGTGMGSFTAALVHEELAHGDAGAALALWAPGLVPAAVLELGGLEQARKILARFGEGAGGGKRGAVAWSEAGKGLPEAGFATTARRDGASWVLDGEKVFVVNGGIADVYVVFAQVEAGAGWGGVGTFVVESGNAGVRPGARAQWVGLETVHAATVKFESARVSDADRLERVDVAGLRRFFAHAALATAARQVGLARASYEYALEYTQGRVAFGKPVAHFQAVSFTLAEMHMDVESARWMVWRAAMEMEKGGEGAAAAVARAAVHANDAAWRVADNGVQLLGGAGFVQDYPVEKWMRDTRALSLVGGTDQVHQLISAGAELGNAGELGDGLPAPWIQPVAT